MLAMSLQMQYRYNMLNEYKVGGFIDEASRI